METPGRDVTADPLGPEPHSQQNEPPAPGGAQDAQRAAGAGEGGDDDKGMENTVREAADKIKEAVTPDDPDERDE
jgi:hypothetical protein